MKPRKSLRVFIYIAAILVFATSLFMAACDTFNPVPAVDALTALRIETPPDKTTYFEGEVFDATGMVVKAEYASGAVVTITQQTDESDGYTLSPSGALSLSNNSVTISYGGKSVVQELSVEALAVTAIAITTPPAKTVYNEGESFSTAAMVVTASYNNGSTAVIPLKVGSGDGYTVTPSGALTTAHTAVTISYRDLSITQSITVNEQIKDTNSIYYSDYGAKGDGVTNDFSAIRSAHAAANATGKKVHADNGAKYYIGDTNQSIAIQTDTDWGEAEFIIDDSEVTGNRSRWVFQVTSKLSTSSLPSSIKTLSKHQASLGTTFSSRALVKVVNSNKKQYIRKGGNANSGSNQTDVFVVEKNGSVDPSSPILWDFAAITSSTVYPIDSTVLTITGGVFTTISNTVSVDATYYARGIQITRSNTVLDGLTHLVTGEGTGDGRYTAGTTNRPYSAFIQTQNCADVTVKNTVLTGRKVFWNNKGTTESPNWVQQGTYDFNANSTVGLTVENCTQTNDITDKTYWGIFTSNFAKNITFDRVEWSRFDAHQGVWNTTIKNSKLGHQGMQIIGGGVLRVENTEVISNRLINLRNDYGSTWEGDIVIKNCTLNATSSAVQIFNGDNDGTHDFGYACHMPENIYIDGLSVTGSIGSSTSDLRFFGSNWGSDSSPHAISIPSGIYVKNLTRLKGSSYQVSSSSRLASVPVHSDWQGL